MYSSASALASGATTRPRSVVRLIRLIASRTKGDSQWWFSLKPRGEACATGAVSTETPASIPTTVHIIFISLSAVIGDEGFNCRSARRGLPESFCSFRTPLRLDWHPVLAVLRVRLGRVAVGEVPALLKVVRVPRMHAQPPVRLAGHVGDDDDPGAVVAYRAAAPSDVRQPFEPHQMAAFILGPAPPNASSAMAAAMRVARRSKRQTSLLDNAVRLKGTPDVAHVVWPVATRISKLTARRLVITFVPTTSATTAIVCGAV